MSLENKDSTQISGNQTSGNRTGDDSLFKYMIDDETEQGYRFWFSGDRDNDVYLTSSKQFDDSKAWISVSPEELEGLMELADEFAQCKDVINSYFFCDNDLSEENSQIESLILHYIKSLLDFLNSAVNSYQSASASFYGYCRVLEELLFLNGKRDKFKDNYEIPVTHPMICMEGYVGAGDRYELENYFNNSKLELKCAERTMLNSIIEAKNRNRYRIKLFGSNKVYEIEQNKEPSSNQKKYTAVAFHNRTGNTQIPAIRLWEKICDYNERHQDLRENIKLAYFGELTDSDNLKENCLRNKINLELVKFEQKKGLGNYFFVPIKEPEKDAANDIYNLLHMADLERLFNTYHIVLFLDMNCFYRQNQEDKSVEEKNVLAKCEWYFQRAASLKKFKSKAFYYRQIYDSAGLWLNSYRNETSGTYEFDEALYHAIDIVPKRKAEVYLYIGCGEKIAGKDLRYYNVCNDEYYDGKRLIVYKYSLDKKEDVDKSYDEYLNLPKQVPLQIRINFWRIVKSISNSFYQVINDGLFEAVHMDFNCLKEIVCILEFTNVSIKDETKISFYLEGNEEDVLYRQAMEQIMHVVLKYAFGNDGLACIRKYFRDMIVHYIITNSRSIEELVFAYLLSSNQLSNITFSKMEWKELPKDQTFLRQNTNLFKTRKTFYTVIESLAELKLRSMEDTTRYLVDGYRRSFCPDINEINFCRMLSEINHCCEEWGYTNSRLYENSKIKTNS